MDGEAALGADLCLTPAVNARVLASAGTTAIGIPPSLWAACGETGEQFFDGVAAALCRELDAELVAIAAADVSPPEVAIGLAAHARDRRVEPWNTAIDDTDWRAVYAGQTVVMAGELAGHCLDRGHAAGALCIAVPMACQDGEVVGHVALYVTNRLGFGLAAPDLTWLNRMKPRIAAELARFAADQARQQEVRAIAAERERLRVTLQSIGDAVIVTDAGGQISSMNAVAERLTGWSQASALGMPIATVLPLVDAQTMEPVPQPVHVALAERRIVAMTGEIALRRRDGSLIMIDDSAVPIIGREDALLGAIAVFRDTTPLRDMLSQVRHMAHYDALTGLPNRALFLDRLAQATNHAKRTNTRAAVLFLDLDRFKSVNDRLGHEAGDRLLQLVGATLTASLRESDTVARFGVDEFVVLLGDLERPEVASRVASKIQAALAAIEEIDGQDVSVSASVGIAIFPDDAEDAEALMRHADGTMHQAKGQGRGHHLFFDPAINEAALRRTQFEILLRKSIDLRQLSLAYQPKVDLSTGAILGAEALIRWQPQPGQIVSPAEFIPIAEETGLIIPIGVWVMREAFRQMRVWRECGLPPISVAVNVSMKSLRDPDFVDALSEALEENELPGCGPEIEITESAIMTDAVKTIEILERIRALGLRVSIDDFGTGYSSLAYLRRLPVDTIKIDRAFVTSMGDTEDDMALVSAIIGMATTLRKHVVAEGVETQEQRLLLQSLGCLEGQGFLFSRPVDPDTFSRLFARRHILR